MQNRRLPSSVFLFYKVALSTSTTTPHKTAYWSKLTTRHRCRAFCIMKDCIKQKKTTIKVVFDSLWEQRDSDCEAVEPMPWSAGLQARAIDSIISAQPHQYSNSLVMTWKRHAHKCALFEWLTRELAHDGKHLKTTKPLQWVACRFLCGSKGIRTPDPLLVRQMLWTSWAMLPFFKAWALQR